MKKKNKVKETLKQINMGSIEVHLAIDINMIQTFSKSKGITVKYQVVARRRKKEVVVYQSTQLSRCEKIFLAFRDFS